MSFEIEKKYRITKEQYEQVTADLEEFKAEYVREDFEENLLFGNEYLKQIEGLVRIRKTQNKNTLTFKQYVSDSAGVKKHLEYESVVESPDEVAKMVKALSFELRMVYEKRRKTWKFREVEVVLDELPFGLFMEIEGTNMQIAEAEMFLGADEFEVEPKTYPMLTKELGRRIGDRIEARFGNNEDVIENTYIN